MYKSLRKTSRGQLINLVAFLIKISFTELHCSTFKLFSVLHYLKTQSVLRLSQVDKGLICICTSIAGLVVSSVGGGGITESNPHRGWGLAFKQKETKGKLCTFRYHLDLFPILKSSLLLHKLSHPPILQLSSSLPCISTPLCFSPTALMQLNTHTQGETGLQQLTLFYYILFFSMLYLNLYVYKWKPLLSSVPF